jgi:hypothetical protein
MQQTSVGFAGGLMRQLRIGGSGRSTVDGVATVDDPPSHRA